MLIEDNPSDADLTRRAFAKTLIPYELVVVENGEDALDYLFCQGVYKGRDPRSSPALVLVDLKLPGVDGMEVIRQVRANPITHRQPMVVLSSSSEERDVAQSYDHGANSYICKPVDFLRFVDAIQEVGRYWLVWNELPAA